MREVRMALLEADVNYKVAKDFIKKVTERCVGQEIHAAPERLRSRSSRSSTKN